MSIKDIVLKNRSFRKFKANETIPFDALLALIDMARVTPSSKNMQPLKYLLLNDKTDTDFVFERLKWAWYLKGWNGPTEEQRPPAYVVMLLDKKLNENAMIDAGIASQTILLGAVEQGLGGCIIRTVNRYEIQKKFNLPDHLEIILVIALGKPDQIVKLTEIDEDGNIQYFENDAQVHFVPKRGMDEIVINKKKS